MLDSLEKFANKIYSQSPNNILLITHIIYILLSIRPRLQNFYINLFDELPLDILLKDELSLLEIKKTDYEYVYWMKRRLNDSYYKVLQFFENYDKFEKKKDIIIDYIKKDDITGFTNYLFQTGKTISDFDMKNDRFSYLSFFDTKDQRPKNPLDLSALYGSILIFKYCIMNNCIPTLETCKYAIAGGNFEIIHLLEQKALSYDNCREISIAYHRYELTEWIETNYKHSPFDSLSVLWYLNFKALIYYEKQEEINCFNYEISSNVELVFEWEIFDDFSIFDQNLDKETISLTILWNYTEFLIYIVDKISNDNKKRKFAIEILPLAINYSCIIFIDYLVAIKLIQPE